MKKTKKICILLLVVLISIGVVIAMFCKLHFKSPTIGIFNLTEYQWEITTFSSDENVGQIIDATDAIEKTKILWKKKYNAENIKLQISFDSNEMCWHISSIEKRNTLGGIMHAIIRENGDVIAVWIDD